MADGKWIPELTPETPLADAARHALALRLSVVRDHLPLALREAEKDIEHVHQLRVATRRAGAVLEIFSVCVPDKEYRAARKGLRLIRRAAGAARDWDVFLLSLGSPEQQRDRNRPAWDFLIGHAQAHREAAQAQLETASPNYPFTFERLLAETVAAVHKPRSEQPLSTLVDLALPMLSGLLKELHQCASGDLGNYDHLHQVRIVGKRLRYAMEVFAACFAPTFKETLYTAVEEMQEMLGNANDSHVAGQRLRAMRERLRLSTDWRRYRAGFDTLIRHHEARVPAEKQRFQEWWAHWQESGGEAAFAAQLQARPSSVAS